MSKVKPGLGRGLDALINPRIMDHIDQDSTDYTNVQKDDGKDIDVLAKIPVELVSSNPFQPRSSFDPEALEELKKSILSNGLIQPITVRRGKDNKYELISGERRLRVYRDIGFKDIPAYIIKVDSDETMLALALIENIQREKLNPIEIALAYKRLMDECHLTQEKIADKVGKDRTTIANAIRLLRLPDALKQSLINEEITTGHARALINLPTRELQLEALKKIKEENLSVRKVEQLVKRLLSQGNISKSFTVSKKQFTNNPHINDIEDRLRKIFGTKVICRQKKDGAGELVIEFYSNEELERLFELFEIIDKKYS